MGDVLPANRDKPHRCPDCHAVAIRSPDQPRWWRVYTCCRCGAHFTRWPRLARLRVPFTHHGRTPMNNLTPAQNARLDQLATRWFRACLWLAAAAWVLFAAAIWVGSWRIAGLGALTTVLSAACLLTAAIFRSPSGRRRAAQKLATDTTEEPHL